MRLIKLTCPEDEKHFGGEIYFNVEKIEALIKRGLLTVVALTNCNNNNYFMVKETPEEIINLIKNAEEI